jgi:hypothetical protein
LLVELSRSLAEPVVVEHPQLVALVGRSHSQQEPAALERPVALAVLSTSTRVLPVPVAVRMPVH